MKTQKPDGYALAQTNVTARSFQKLAALRGISSTIEVDPDTGHYIANGTDCGLSVHGLYDWLNSQPGVLP
jgi:hypothetical protein